MGMPEMVTQDMFTFIRGNAFYSRKVGFGVKKTQTYVLKYFLMVFEINKFSLTFNQVKLTYTKIKYWIKIISFLKNRD